MRIVIVAPDLSAGSVASAARRHAIELSKHHAVHVITRSVPPGLPSRIDAVLVHPRSWKQLRRFCHVPNELAFIWSARQALLTLSTRESPDLVWCHSHGLTALGAAPLKQRLRFRLVMTTHGDIFDRPKGTYSRELTWFYKAVTPTAYRQADSVHVLSPHMASLAIARGARSAETHIIPHGLDPRDIGLAEVTPRAAGSFMPGGMLRILYVGSLWRVKGVEALVRATAMLSNRPVSVTLIGDGPERSSLEALAARLGLAKTITFHGQVPRHDLARHYHEADVLCVPSLSEALSLATLEAMFCALPVIASNVGGIPSLVTDGETGHLVAPGDVRGLADGIRRASASQEHLAALGERGVRRAQSDFGWPVIADKLNALAECTRLTESLPQHPVDGAIR
jgi:glycosyltransferase involved in cell wall biosynthesis